MEDILGAMWLVSPIVLAMMACVAIGFAVTAREAMGRERGFREAREQAHEDEASALTDAKEKAERELRRHRRLLDCHVDALIAAMADGRARPIPWPGRVLEAFCATVPTWQRKLDVAAKTGREHGARAEGGGAAPEQRPPDHARPRAAVGGLHGHARSVLGAPVAAAR